MALAFHEKGFTIPKTISDCKSKKKMKHLCLQGYYLEPKMGRRGPAWQLARNLSGVAK